MWTTYPDTLGDGPQGVRGPTGGFTFFFNLEDEGAGPPTDGMIQPDDNDLSIATNLYVSDEDRFTEDIEAILDIIEAGDRVKVFSEANNRRWAVFEVVDNTQETGYHDIEVDFVAQGQALLEGEKIGFSLIKREGTPAPTVMRVRKISDTKTDGDVDLVTDTPTAISGLSVTFTLPTGGGDVVLLFAGTLYNAGGGLMEGELGYKVDSGSYVPGTQLWIGNGAGDDGTVRVPVAFQAYITGLAAGSHTIQIWGVSYDDTDTYLKADTTYPAVMTVLYEDEE